MFSLYFLKFVRRTHVIIYKITHFYYIFQSETNIEHITTHICTENELNIFLVATQKHQTYVFIKRFVYGPQEVEESMMTSNQKH